jgi:hypothetical protein
MMMMMRTGTVKKRGARCGHVDVARPDGGDGDKQRLDAQREETSEERRCCCLFADVWPREPCGSNPLGGLERKVELSLSHILLAVR